MRRNCAMASGLMPRSDATREGARETGRVAPFLREIWGPSLVIAGASMWGLETLWRVRLNAKFDADTLVFHEHWMGLAITLPFLIRGAGRLRGISRKAIVSMVGSGVLGSAL